MKATNYSTQEQSNKAVLQKKCLEYVSSNEKCIRKGSSKS